MELEHGLCTHVGRRTHNEDACVADGELGLFLVADGMGGHAGGGVASRVAANAAAEVVAKHRHSSAPSAWVAWRALEIANEQVCLRQRGALATMGTTLSMLLFRHAETIVAHVGDSRVYRLRGERFARLTRDHTLEAGLLAAGAPAERARAVAHVLTRVVGVRGALEPDVRRVDARSGDVFLLCTDGLSDTVDDPALARGLVGPPGAAATALVDAANRGGGVDNITALVVHASAR
jgi:serine/threonine protein phosphatase PrpC